MQCEEPLVQENGLLGSRGSWEAVHTAWRSQKPECRGLGGICMCVWRGPGWGGREHRGEEGERKCAQKWAVHTRSVNLHSWAPWDWQVSGSCKDKRGEDFLGTLNCQGHPLLQSPSSPEARSPGVLEASQSLTEATADVRHLEILIARQAAMFYRFWQ